MQLICLTHPVFVFLLLILQGLEFDDVIVAFEKDKLAWNASGQSVDCLRNLRELYVAITRAKKKVIILEKGKFMREFFANLSCDFDKTAAAVAIKDIGKFTSAAEWFDEGMKYFRDENYELAKVIFLPLFLCQII